MSMVPPTEALRTFAPPGLARTELVTPRSVDEACELLARDALAGSRTVLLAGGTDWIVDRHLVAVEKATPVDRVIDLSALEELTRIAFLTRDGERWMSLGGGVTYWALRRDARVLGTIPMLAAMARDVGAVQIQTRGTLGGNLASASPAADGVPALMALGGVAVLRSVRGDRRVALDDFFVGYRRTALAKDEILVAVDVRMPRDGARVTWRKVGTRLAQAISKVALGAVIETDDRGVVTRARFGMASVAPSTAPLRGVRAFLEGQRLAEVGRAAVDAAVAAELKPIDDVRSTAAYRLHVAQALVWRAIRDA